MKSKKAISLLLVLAVCVSVFAGCGGSKSSSSSDSGGNTQQAQTDTSASTDSDTSAAADTGSGELDPYTFSVYYSYDWYSIKPWGDDEASKFLKNKFNVDLVQSKPDADADAKLNLMVSSGDMPDAIVMDRGPNNIKIAKLGLLADLAPFQANNSDYDDNILPQTQELLKIDGKLYGIPNWARKGATGGNEAWIYEKRLYEAAGSPELKTFDDLYDYAKYIKDNVPTTAEGQSTYPFATGDTKEGFKILHGFYRSFGGSPRVEDRYARVDGKMQLVYRDPRYRAAVMEANKWYREGLIPDMLFTDTQEMITEKYVAGRTALLYYDFSQDSITRFRQLLMESHPDDSYEVLTDPVYPPANGLSLDKVYADEKPTPGWNVNCITTKATNPQRIFDLYSYMLTTDGSINMMYGPQGDLWDEKDENGIPILKTAESELSSSEKDRLGLWFWAQPAHSDNVDLTKFAVNDMQPADKQDWTISIQANVLTPLMFVTDEHVGIADVIETGTDEAINRKLCNDQIAAQLPKIIMADSAEKAEKLYDELIAFCDANGIAEVERLYDEKYQANIKLQGYSAYE